ncbi:hypothetical protein LNQ52_27600 [Klebsiella pneumoniae subsp. pneumoniae]|nr:hypothetical protein [Klebsiella pneumoniae subsp. pneumoniae]
MVVEEIHCGLSIGFQSQPAEYLSVGNGPERFPEAGEVAYVMNANGKTISRYEHLT